MRSIDPDLIELVLQRFALGKLIKQLALVRQGGQPLAVGAPAVEQFVAMVAKHFDITDAQKAPGSGIAIDFGENVVFRKAGAAENLAGIVSEAARSRAQGF